MPKKCQNAKQKFVCQTLTKNAKFELFGIKNANMATLPATRNLITEREVLKRSSANTELETMT